MKHIKHNKKIALSIVAVFLLTAFLSYGTPSRDPISRAVKSLYPQAIVGSDIVSVNEMEKAWEIGRGLDPQFSREQVEREYLRRSQMAQLARGLDTKFDSDTVSDELTYLTKGKDKELDALLKNYFQGKLNAFEEYVAYPSAVDAKLRIYFNSDLTRNKSAMDRANELLAKINNGLVFEEAAKEASDDKYTAQIGGSLGFYEHGQIIPELEKAINISTFGEVKKDVVISRFGYHIVYPVETAVDSGKKLWHAKHILIATSGFEQWLESSLKQVKIFRIK